MPRRMTVGNNALNFFYVYEYSHASVLAVLKYFYEIVENLKKYKNVFELDSLVNDVIDWYLRFKDTSDFFFRKDGETSSFKAHS